jgi:hypothetical protein
MASSCSRAAGFSSLATRKGAVADDRARLLHVLRPLHEAQADVVHAQFQRNVEVAPVLVGQGRERQHHAGDVDPLAIGQGAADQHAGVRGCGVAALDHQAQLPVVQQQVAVQRCRSARVAVDAAGAFGPAGDSTP